MRSRRTVLVSAVGLILAVAMGAGTLIGSSRATVAPGFQELRTRLQTFSTAKLALTIADDRYTAGRRVLLLAKRSGEGAVQFLEGTRFRFTRMSDGSVWENRAQATSPVSRPEMVPMVAQFWVELRSGFAGSQWQEESPSEYGFADVKGRHPWASIRMPFPWAQGLVIFVALDRGANSPVNVVILKGDTFYYGAVSEIAWDGTIHPSILGTTFPDLAKIPWPASGPYR